MNGEIRINDLEVFYHVGVTEEERAQAQRLLLTIRMEANLDAAAKSDRLEDTIDYYAVVQEVIAYGRGRYWNLIEKVAADIAELALAGYKPASVEVTVKKFAVPEAGYISVTLARPDKAG